MTKHLGPIASMMKAFGTREEFPYAATTYRVTEHHHYWTKHAKSSAIVQPAPFIEIGETIRINTETGGYLSRA